MSQKRVRRRRVGWGLVIALVSVGLLVGVTLAADGFGDDDGSVHEAAIDALVAEGILEGTGCGQSLICPGEPLERWTMAVWLVRALDEKPSTAGTRFADVDRGVWWASYTERLAELGVTSGCATGPARYCPDRPVTRGQMATFIARALDLQPAPMAGFVATDGHTHAANIDALAAAGITAGCATGPARYCPDRPVTRGQMATFIARAFGLGTLSDPPATGAGVPFTAVATNILNWGLYT